MGKTKVILALDYNNASDVRNLLTELGTDISYLKVGMELFYSEGVHFLRELKNMNIDKGQQYKIFLDLKLHDIPNTVVKALSALLKHGDCFDMVNVHAQGGRELLHQVGELKRNLKTQHSVKIIAVTLLTSLDESNLYEDLLVDRKYSDLKYVLHLATLAKRAGLDGVVASAREIQEIKKNLGKDFLVVTPGIKINSDLNITNDQKRVVSAKEALDLGADYIVIGRDITKSSDPKEMLRKLHSTL